MTRRTQLVYGAESHSMEIVTQEEIERVGELADRADYFLGLRMNIPLSNYFEVLDDGMKTLRDELRKLYIAMSGENRWE